MYENMRKDGFIVNIEKLESIEDPCEKAFVKSLLDYFEKNGVPGKRCFRPTAPDVLENMGVMDRLNFLDGNPETKPRAGYLHYDSYAKMQEEKREAVSLMVKAISDATLSSGRKAIDVYKMMDGREQMATESIILDLFS